jgi:hypothetical protein
MLTFGGVICVLFGCISLYEELAYLLRHSSFVRFSFIKAVSSFLMHSDMLKCFSTCCEAFPLVRHLPVSWDIPVFLAIVFRSLLLLRKVYSLIYFSLLHRRISLHFLKSCIHAKTQAFIFWRTCLLYSNDCLLRQFCSLFMRFPTFYDRLLLNNDWHKSRWDFWEEQLDAPFFTTKKWRNLGIVESRTSWPETKKIQIKLTTTCNKHEQQQDARNNVQL